MMISSLRQQQRRFRWTVVIACAMAFASFTSCDNEDDGKRASGTPRVTIKSPKKERKKKAAEERERIRKEELLKKKEMEERAQRIEEQKRTLIEKKLAEAKEQCLKEKEQLAQQHKVVVECVAECTKVLNELMEMEDEANEILEDGKKKLGAMGEPALGRVKIPKLGTVASEKSIPEVPDVSELLDFSCDFKIGDKPPERPAVNFGSLIRACKTQKIKLTLLHTVGQSELDKLRSTVDALVKDHYRINNDIDRLLANMAYMKYDDFQKCIVIIRSIDDKWSKGKGYAKFQQSIMAVWNDQPTRDLVTQGVTACYNGNHEQGISLFKEARKKNLHWYAYKVLKRNCKTQSKLKPRKCY